MQNDVIIRHAASRIGKKLKRYFPAGLWALVLLTLVRVQHLFSGSSRAAPRTNHNAFSCADRCREYQQRRVRPAR